MAEKDTGLAVQEHAGLPVPVFRGQQMVEALKQYKELQKALDEAMPDQILKLGEKDFRKKGYWRALATAFDLTVKPLTREQDERSVVGTLEDGSDNYVYTVTYTAATPSGRTVTGDGTCAAAEKARGRMDATEHNVRSHAHTRAFNRAVSNLVGFGEVSAEEAERPPHHGTTTATPVSTDGVKPASDGLLYVKEVRRATAEKKPSWIKISDGREGSTFDTKLVDVAEDLKRNNTPIAVEFEVKGKYTNLIKIEAASANGAALPLAKVAPALEDKEPFGQPEKILTVTARDAKGQKLEGDAAKDAKYWDVQSDKHQYLTNKAEFRDFAQGLKTLGAKALIASKPMVGKDGLPRRNADGVPQYEMTGIDQVPEGGTAAPPAGVQEGEVVANDEMPAFAGME